MVITDNRGTYDMPSDFENDDAKMIEKCLNCKKSKCTDCLDGVHTRHKANSKYDEKYIKSFLKGDCTAKQVADKLQVDVGAIYDWLRRYCFEHDIPYPNLRRRRVRKW